MILHFVPQRRAAQTFLNDLRDRQVRPVDFGAIGDIFENGFGKRIRPLEHHSNAAAKLRNVLRKNILSVEQNFPFQACIPHGFVHAVERPQQGGLAAARWTDQRSHAIGGNAHVDVKEGLLFAVEEINL